MWLYKKRRSAACKLAIIFVTGFRAASGRSRPAHDDRKKTARYPSILVLAEQIKIENYGTAECYLRCVRI